MVRWLRIAVLLLTLGGAFAAISQLFSTSQDIAHWGTRELISAVLLTAYFVWGTVLGLLLVEGHDLNGQLVAYLALQIPYVSTPWFEYHVGLGLSAFCGYEGGVSFAASLGVNATIGLLSHGAWALKVNVVAIVALFALKRAALRPLFDRLPQDEANQPIAAAPTSLDNGPLTTRSSGR